MNQINQSIHPRVVNGRTQHPKVNTSKPRRTKLKEKTVNNMKKHLDTHPKDAMTAGRLSKNS